MRGRGSCGGAGAAGTRRGRSAADAGPGQLRERGGTGDGPEPVRGVSQRLVLAVAELDLSGGDIALQLLDAGRAGDGGHTRMADDPGQGDLGRAGVMGVGVPAPGAWA